MPEISTALFNGGINNVIDSHLLQPNFSKDLRNCKIQNGSISSANAPAALDIPDPGLIYQTGTRSVVKYGGVFYWSDNVTGELDSSLGYLGINTPTNKATASQGVPGGRFPAGTSYKWFYTWVTADGFRSAPFSTTDVTEFTVTGDDLGTINLVGFDPNIPDYVSDLEVWRTVDGGSVFFFSGTLDRWANDGDFEYIDQTPDQDILLNEQYNLASAAGKPESGRYLTERNSVFYLAVDDKVFFSEPANPHQYGALSFVTFDDTVTGTISTETFTMVFTRNRAYKLTGDSEIDIFKEEIPDAQGVLNWQTVSRVKNMPLWVSNDGLCAYQPYDNRSGRKITVLTENLFKIAPGALYATVANEVYYLFYEDETVAFDFVDGLKIYRLDWKFDWAWYDKDDDILVGKKNSVYFNAEGGDELEWTYLSPEFVAEDMQKLKQFGRMAADSDSDLNMTFFADGVEVWSHLFAHDGSNHRREFISPLVEGRRIQVKITGKGTLRGINYEYITRRL